MDHHLRFAGQPADLQLAALRDIIGATPVLFDALLALRAVALPDSWLVSGAIYNSVWNHLTGRPAMTGINDLDIFYFDPSDLGYAAEDRVIQKTQPVFAALPVPAQVRNQARVHLWFEQRFGASYPPLRNSTEAIDRFATRAHAVGARLERDDTLTLYAPYGLDDLFGFRLVPNRLLDNRDTHARKAARAVAIWPELAVEPW